MFSLKRGAPEEPPHPLCPHPDAASFTNGSLLRGDPRGLGIQLKLEEKESSWPGGAALHCRAGLFPAVTEAGGP